MLDPISDMLTRIRNAARAGHATVRMPSSKMKVAIANVLAKEGFIETVDVQEERGNKKTLTITLRYRDVDHARRISAIRAINRVSREGQRIYKRSRELFPVKNGLGCSIVSTSQGVMTGDDARKKHLGGEVICEVW